MYEYLEGTVHQLSDDNVVVDVRGVGYRVCVPKGVARSEGRCTVRLYVELVVRDDSHTLYGFQTPLEREWFLLLQRVSGIGPKLSISILSHSSTEQLEALIGAREVRALAAIPGIGKRLAERMVTELQPRLGTVSCHAAPSGVLGEAMSALETLGFSKADARKKVLDAHRELAADASMQQLVQCALAQG